MVVLGPEYGLELAVASLSRRVGIRAMRGRGYLVVESRGRPTRQASGATAASRVRRWTSGALARARLAHRRVRRWLPRLGAHAAVPADRAAGCTIAVTWRERGCSRTAAKRRDRRAYRAVVDVAGCGTHRAQCGGSPDAPSSHCRRAHG